MSLGKAILHGKKKRRPYRGSKAIDPSCRNHGDCPVCRENRLHKFRDKHPMMKEDIIVTDEEYLFKQTEIERKKLGYGDKHKKRGGGRYVRLPSDNLTRKEKEALNGEIKTWKEKEFYTWEEFKELPDDVALKWVNSMTSRYSVGMGIISRCVFNKKALTLSHEMERRGLKEYVNRCVTGGAASKGKKLLLEAIEAKQYAAPAVEAPMEEETTQEDDQKIIEEVTEPAPEVAPEIVESVKKAPAEPIRNIDMHNIALLLSSLAGTGAKLTIEVTL